LTSRIRHWLASPEAASFLASFVSHTVAMLALALLFHVAMPRVEPVGLLASVAVSEPLDWITLEKPPLPEIVLREPEPVAVARIGQSLDVSLNRAREEPAGHALSPQAATHLLAPTDDALLLAADTARVGGLEGRSSRRRQELGSQRGATPQSEAAVEKGLRWLLAHQLPSGAWHFDFRRGLCQGQCRNPGTETSTTAATALALLPFLGAGYTHRQGEYQDAVNRGLYYLSMRARATPQGLDLQEGTMYSQALAAIALCESYAMTGDESLRDRAQGAIDFIVYAQDRNGGGWRYRPGEPGDTTVTGWILMALKSGQIAKLNVPSPAIGLVNRFLDSVQSDQGSRYGYMTPEPRQTTTAIGLLCRMYLGWERTHPALGRGVEHLGAWGPAPDNIYFNYYTAQVLHHYEGSAWSKWNQPLRDLLIRTQATEGHESGSWHFPDRYGDRGGRLYSTAMAVMTLEVYYRYMPLYGPKAVRGEF